MAERAAVLLTSPLRPAARLPLPQVLTEVYALRALPLPEHVGVSLVLHKVVDPRQGVRDAARGLLGMLARRAWGRDARYRCVRLDWKDTL